MAQRHDFDGGGAFFEVLWLVNAKKDARIIEYRKKHFSESKQGAEWAK